jgi:hypothetical protein
MRNTNKRSFKKIRLVKINSVNRNVRADAGTSVLTKWCHALIQQMPARLDVVRFIRRD